VTRVVYELDGVESAWASRRHRKPQRPGHGAGSSYRTRSWWIAVLFMIGSSCFAVGALPGYASLVGVGADGVTFFVGSIFFTSAAALQYVEAVNARRSVTTTTQRFRLVSWEPHRIDWLATAIQLIGTLFFNVSTFRAMVESFDAAPASLLSWRPDALGSICFLVASWLAYAEAGHRWLSWRPHDVGWTISALNLLGSVLFGLSAIGAYVINETGELLDAAIANSGTVLGALAFLVGAYLLLPETKSTPAGDGSVATPRAPS
jgi:hypothetical protein